MEWERTMKGKKEKKDNHNERWSERVIEQEWKNWCKTFSGRIFTKNDQDYTKAKKTKKLQSNVKSQKSEKEFEENGEKNKNFTETDDVKKYQDS